MYKFVEYLTNSILKIQLSQNNKILGEIRIYINSYNSKSFITNIKICHKYSNNGLGRKLLSYTETKLQKEYNIKEIELTSYEKQGDTLNEFYLKQNYRKTNMNLKPDYIDDGEYIYNLYHFKKSFKDIF